MIATTSDSWWPFIIMVLGGAAWTLLWIEIASHYERHNGPLLLAVIPVLIGMIGLVGIVEALW